MSLYAADGSFNVTVVDGTTLTGLYAANGSINVVERDGTTLTGLYHPCGAWNVVVSNGSTLGTYHPCGAFNVSVSPYQYNAVKVTVVSGSFGGGTDSIYGLAGLFGTWS